MARILSRRESAFTMILCTKCVILCAKCVILCAKCVILKCVFVVRGTFFLISPNARKLQNWECSWSDLSSAQKLDFDDVIEDSYKFVVKKWKRIEKIRITFSF